MKILSDVLQKSPIKVKVGTKDGDGFMFCGRFTQEAIDDLDDEIIIKKAKQIAQCESNIGVLERQLTWDGYVYVMNRRFANAIKKAKREAENRGKALTDAEENLLKKEYEPTEAKFAENCVNTENKIERILKKERKIAKSLKNYVSISERKIVESYASIDEPNTTIVLLEGREAGNAWTTEEYENLRRSVR